jgi:hypothetical protein
MLPWPQRRLRKKNIFLAKLCVFSSLIHVFLCFSLFFMYKSYKSDMTLTVHASNKADDVIIRLLPLSAKKPVQKKIASGIAVKKTKTAVKKKPTMQLAKVKKSIPKKVVPVKKTVIEKKIASNSAKASMDKKVEPVKKIEKKPEVKRIAAVETKKPEVKKIAQAEVKPKVEEKKVKVKKEPVIEQEENVRYVTHKELRGLQLEKALQQAVQEVWSPPVGIEETVMSEVQVTVGWDGALIESQVIKPTDIVIYDVAVQDALDEIKFPREVWGKEIKIAFRP